MLEGLDASGTTTQQRLLVDHLNEVYRGNRTAIASCEPTDSDTGRLIRQMLTKHRNPSALTLAFLYAADRNEHVFDQNEGILARTRRGEIVVSDRYLYSSIAYQGAFLDRQTVETINAAFPLPEHLVFIDTSATETERRLRLRPTRDALERQEIQAKVAEQYERVLEAAATSDTKITRVDGNQTVEAVFADVKRAVAHAGW